MNIQQYTESRINQAFEAALKAAGIKSAAMNQKRKSRLLALYWQGASIGAKVVHEINQERAKNEEIAAPARTGGGGSKAPQVCARGNHEKPGEGSQNGEGQNASGGDV